MQERLGDAAAGGRRPPRALAVTRNSPPVSSAVFLICGRERSPPAVDHHGRVAPDRLMRRGRREILVRRPDPIPPERRVVGGRGSGRAGGTGRPTAIRGPDPRGAEEDASARSGLQARVASWRRDGGGAPGGRSAGREIGQALLEKGMVEGKRGDQRRLASGVAGVSFFFFSGRRGTARAAPRSQNRPDLDQTDSVEGTGRVREGAAPCSRHPRFPGCCGLDRHHDRLRHRVVVEVHDRPWRAPSRPDKSRRTGRRRAGPDRTTAGTSVRGTAPFPRVAAVPRDEGDLGAPAGRRSRRSPMIVCLLISCPKSISVE